MAILIEGTRTPKPYIRSGFYHIAQNNDADIVFWINNYQKNKVELSAPIKNTVSKTVLCEKLKEFLSKKSDYSFYPNKCSDIRFRDELPKQK